MDRPVPDIAADVLMGALDTIVAGSDITIDSDISPSTVALDALFDTKEIEAEARILEFRQLLMSKPGMNQILREYDEHFKIKISREGTIDGYD